MYQYVLALALASSIATSAHAQETITLDHAFAKGENLDFKFEGFQIVHSENTGSSDEKYMGLEGKIRLTVTAVDKQRRFTNAMVKIMDLKFQSARKGPWTPSELKGLSIKIDRAGRRTAIERLDGKPVSEMDNEAIGFLFPAIDGEISETKTFGPGKKVKVGDTWTPDTTVLATSLGNSLRTQVKPEQVKSTFRLAAKTQVAGKECLEVAGEVQAKAVAIPMSKDATADMAIVMSGCFDASGLRLKNSQLMKFTVKVGDITSKAVRAMTRTVF